ncbi:MAG: hypothetical protein JXR10_01475 [Cyclobacteriaceae bacterium]
MREQRELGGCSSRHSSFWSVAEKYWSLFEVQLLPLPVTSSECSDEKSLF